MKKEEMAKAYAEGFSKEYREIAYDAFLCGYDAKCSTETPNDLEEAAVKFADREYMVGDVDRSALYKGFWHGAKYQKEQMMEEAVEGEVVKDISNKLAVTAKINLDGFKFGDKVRIVIVKED